MILAGRNGNERRQDDGAGKREGRRYSALRLEVLKDFLPPERISSPATAVIVLTFIVGFGTYPTVIAFMGGFLSTQDHGLWPAAAINWVIVQRCGNTTVCLGFSFGYLIVWFEWVHTEGLLILTTVDFRKSHRSCALVSLLFYIFLWWGLSCSWNVFWCGIYVCVRYQLLVPQVFFGVGPV